MSILRPSASLCIARAKPCIATTMLRLSVFYLSLNLLVSLLFSCAPQAATPTPNNLQAPAPAPNPLQDQLLSMAERSAQELGLTIAIDRLVPDTWKGVQYSLVRDPTQLQAYLKLLVREYKKYPSGYLKKARADTLVLGLDLAFEGQNRAAIPDPYSRLMYLAINGAYGVQDEAYLVHVMHHELQHSVDHVLLGEMSKDWPEWLALNPRGFRYGTGGTMAYEDSQTDYYSPTHPSAGFINRYSMTGDEEDRAELIAWLLTPGERVDFLRIYNKDSIVRAKYALLRTTLHNFAGAEFLPLRP